MLLTAPYRIELAGSVIVSIAAMDQTLRTALANDVVGICGLELLVLFGSRAKGRLHGLSDWDFGFVASAPVDVLSLIDLLSRRVRSNSVDLVDLRAAGALLRYRVARDGIVLWSKTGAEFPRFQYEAASFWCDVEPVVRQAHQQILANLAS